MKKIFILLLFSCFIYACSSDDNAAKEIEIPLYDTYDLIPFEEDNLWGFYHAETGDIIIKAQYEELINFNSYGVALVKKKGLWGGIMPNGKYLIKPIYTEMTEYNSEGLSRVKLNNKYGLVDEVGNIKFKIEYDSIRNFSNYDHIVVVKNKKYGMIDRKLNFLVEPQYDYIEDFFNHSGFIKLGQKTGLINKKGEVLLKPIYDKIHKFNLEGYAFLEIDNKIGIYQRDGKLLKPQFDHIDDMLQHYENREQINYFNVTLNGLWGTINGDLEYIVTPRFEHNYKLPSFIDKGNKKYAKFKMGGKYGIINDKYDWVIKPQYDDMQDLTYEIDYILVKKGEGYGMIDITGKTIVPLIYDHVNYWDERDCFIVNKNNKKSIQNKDGKRLKGYYDRITDMMFSYNLPFYILEVNDKQGIIDYNLTNVVNVEYDRYNVLTDLTNKNSKYISLSKNELTSIFNITTRQFTLKDLFTNRFPQITKDEYIIGEVNDRLAIYKLSGEKIAHFPYELDSSLITREDSGLMRSRDFNLKIEVMINYRTGKELAKVPLFGSSFDFLINNKFSSITNDYKKLEVFTNMGVKIFEFNAERIMFEYSRDDYKFQYFHFNKGEYAGLLDINGKILVPADRYHRIIGFGPDGLAEVMIGNKSGKIDKTGKLVVPVQ